MRTIDERTVSWDSTLQTVLENAGTGIRVAIPGIVTKWDKDQQTVEVQPAIREIVSSGGEANEMNIPLLLDVPVVMPRAGGYSLVFAPKPGDECLVVFGDMCIDAWWQSGGIQSQADSRRHDLSDAFAILGCWSQPNKPSIPEDGCRLQTDGGGTCVEISGNEVNIRAETVNITGVLNVNSQPYLSHTHSGVEQGSGSTGGVNGAGAV